MPSLRGVTVHVTDHKGEELAEWGVQRLRQSTGKSEKVSAYIQSNTGVQFHVSLQPQIPFVDVDHLEPASKVNGVDQMEAEEANRGLTDFGSTLRRLGGSSPCFRAGSEDRSTNHHQRTEHGKEDLALSSPIRRRQNYSKIPKYWFMASLFLDGRKTPERKVIIYLDPADKDFARPDGKVFFKHRWVQSKDGTMTEHAWVFEEKAIESVFDTLMIATNEARNKGHDEDAINEAMRSSGLGSEDGSWAKQSKVGQIVVELRRVTLGALKYDKHYRSKHQQGQDDDIDMAGMKPDVTHATGFLYRSTIAPSPLRVVDYWDYKPEEGIWATFQFFYRSAGTLSDFTEIFNRCSLLFNGLEELVDVPIMVIDSCLEQLDKFGFLGFQKTSKPARRVLNARMAYPTPLNLVQPLMRDQKRSKPVIESFEKKMNLKKFELEDDQPKLGFESEYREASVDDEMEVEESHKYPAAGLPFFVPKVPKVRSQRDVTLPGLPTLDQSAVFDVASTLTAAKTLVDLKQPTDTSRSRSSNAVPLFSAIESPSYNRHHHEARLRLSPYPDIGDAAIRPSAGQLSLATPTSLTTQQGSITLSRNSLTKENVAKLSVVSGRGLPIAPSAHAENGDADDEDTNDELQTESDLETHADDEAFDYSANSEENTECHHVLRSQFKSFTLRKRMHAEVEDAEEERRGSEKDGMADKEVGDGGAGSQTQATSVVPMTEQETADGHHDKKARTVSSRISRDLLCQPLSSPGGTADSTTGKGNVVQAQLNEQD